jgi:hypothetical protein
LEVKSSINQIKISMESITDSKRKNNKDWGKGWGIIQIAIKKKKKKQSWLQHSRILGHN